jgi:hypothetical protein
MVQDRGWYEYNCEEKFAYSDENFLFSTYLIYPYSIALTAVCAKIPIANINPNTLVI